MIPYGKQALDDADIAAVVEVLRSDWLTQGPAIETFEKAVQSATGAPHAVALSSATAALHAAYKALGLAPGQRLWTSPITFVATSNAALYCGAEVDFVDIDPATANLSPTHLAEKLARAEKEGTLPSIVVPVHFGGQPCDMEAIASLAERYGFRIVEDASHAIGGSYQDHPIGACTFSSAAIFSFHPVKIVTTGEGGVVTVKDGELAESLRRFRTHGISRNAQLYQAADRGPWYYEQIELGYNYRMTDIQAALGTSQLRKLAAYQRRRAFLADRYDELLRELPVQPLCRTAHVVSAWHLYAVKISGGAERRRKVFEAMRAAGIGVNVHYIPVYWQPYYRRFGFQPGYCPDAEAYYAAAISLPLFPALREDQQDEVVRALRQALEANPA